MKLPYRFGEESIEYDKEYEYLGVKFTQNEKFGAATTCFIAKAKAASAANILPIYRFKINTFVTYKKLFELLVNSILLYASPVYAIQYLDELEKVQLQLCNMHKTRSPKLCFHKMMSDLAQDKKAGKSNLVGYYKVYKFFSSQLGKKTSSKISRLQL